MKPLADAERWKARGLILSLDWADEPSLARRAEQWVLEFSMGQSGQMGPVGGPQTTGRNRPRLGEI